MTSVYCNLPLIHGINNDIEIKPVIYRLKCTGEEESCVSFTNYFTDLVPANISSSTKQSMDKSKTGFWDHPVVLNLVQRRYLRQTISNCKRIK